MEAKPYPINFEILKKGDTIPTEVIENWSGIGRFDRRYPLQMLRLRNIIEKRIPEDWTIVSEGDTIKVLTDEEASAYLVKSQQQHAHGIARDHTRLLAVDTSKLLQTKDHDRRVMMSAFLTTALTTAKKQIRLIPYKKD